MELYSGIIKKTEKISLVGLGYVGLPIGIAFARKINNVGFDISEDEIELYPTREVGDDAVKNTSVEFTCNEAKLQEVRFHNVAVPNPVNEDRTPDLRSVQSASRTVGRNLVRVPSSSLNQPCIQE